MFSLKGNNIAASPAFYANRVMTEDESTAAIAVLSASSEESLATDLVTMVNDTTLGPIFNYVVLSLHDSTTQDGITFGAIRLSVSANKEMIVATFVAKDTNTTRSANIPVDDLSDRLMSLITGVDESTVARVDDVTVSTISLASGVNRYPIVQ